MDIKDILSVGLTAEDFEMMIKGIDAIPDKEAAEESLKDMGMVLMASLISKTQADVQLRKMEAAQKDRKLKSEAKKEDLVILKSKLIMLKRLLLTNDAVKMAKDIIAPPFVNM